MPRSFGLMTHHVGGRPGMRVPRAVEAHPCRPSCRLEGMRATQGTAMKRDSRTGRYMTTGRSSAAKSGAGSAFERVHSKGGEILVTNTKRASDSFKVSVPRDATYAARDMVSGKPSGGKARS